VSAALIPWGLVALGYAVASRLAYVGYVWRALARADADPRRGGGHAFVQFRRRAALLMNHDGLSFVIMCIITRGTLVPVPLAVWRLVGAGLVLVGVAVKLWAARALGADGYYWRDFFEPGTRAARVAVGPYRYLKNPMYTVGYVQTYGAALLLGSLPGLAAAAFDQAAILALYRAVERPHYERLYGPGGAAALRA
jgi:protein-S-isoprenylcysteine O-methyltransferase Ste14